ncbi:gamma-glutamyltransferase [Pelagovum pacificum]|uniref:Glutathione hydrolase proenzyme n=1 Tax=Pelagovum pacificum TaxID=2588711 RepID=A0A5C5GGD6_9RHOB|nr:gamma-glutamyltransferase [Pelagovum pacificum]QQA43104.1 gamma-glutamyltransferase [Pelagovum pacificum]TNY33753.1 gamma-glutamyltransferase [Pelagovum pacificum]
MRDLQLPGRSPVFAMNGMCATSHPLAAKVAVQMLEAGGNAVDAAIAGAALLEICEPMMTGIGGDCFALIAPPEGDVIAVNGSGRAPAGLSAEALRGEGLSSIPANHAVAVTIPGAIDAFCRMAKEWGTRSIADLFAPAIHYAEAGVPVSQRTGADWAQVSDLGNKARDIFLKDGAAYRIGEVFRRPGIAEVMRRVALDGREAFYEGEIAEDMVATLRAMGGIHTMEDFAATACDIGTPVSTHYSGHDVLEHRPNGQGATALLLLNILSHFDIGDLDPYGVERAHIEAEATKLAYDARNRFVADPDHMARLEHMIAPETAEKLAGLIRKDRALPIDLPGAENAHKDTVYITVVDRNRMKVSLIYSIFHSFGSGIASDKFGILFQNRGCGFTLEEGHANEAGPGKRPMHTIIPGMLASGGKVVMPFGVMGGQYQANGHARLLTNMLDFGMDPQEAIDGPRSFPEAGGALTVERGYADDVRQGLADLGHEVRFPDTPIGGAQAIRVNAENVLEAGSDPRKDGCALGY